MSFDLILTRDCPPREAHVDGELISLSNALELQEQLHAETGDDASSTEPPSDDLELDGERLSLGDIRERLRQAWPRLSACMGCPLNLRGRPVGCHVRLDYPIDSETERIMARAASLAASDPLVADSLLARTPVATPAFRSQERGIFEGAFSPWVQVPLEGSVKAVPLDSFWDLLFEPRCPEDGLAVARVLVVLRQEVEKETRDLPGSIGHLLDIGYALRVFVAAQGEAGYAVSG